MYIGELISIYPQVNFLSVYMGVIIDQLKIVLEVLNGKN
jgi:hypothetical protein